MAKHGDELAPTVEFQSTGAMTEYEFMLFKQFIKEMIPTMSHAFGIHLDPKFKLDERSVWHLPVGDLKRLDRSLADEDSEYRSLAPADYM
jgi:hypothetical protein